MANVKNGDGKLPGKTLYAGRRRETTRKSGFSVHSNTTGGEFKRHSENTYDLLAGEVLGMSFTIDGHASGDILGYGAWVLCDGNVDLTITGGPAKRTQTNYEYPSWNKFGSIWRAETDVPVQIHAILAAKTISSVAIYMQSCGKIRHKYLDDARPELMKNMYQFSPESIFLGDDPGGAVEIIAPRPSGSEHENILLKSCNRCGRYLPVNIGNERDHLSFSNHCVAEHRRPCSHGSFGRLRNSEDEADFLKLDYGFQLECRFCKKFEVNAAHNPQRSSAQMKEDGARRRAFELLLADLYGGTPQLRYRHANGKELADMVWTRFNGHCFRCNAKLLSARAMHLDHTRPLALLWPLDGSATALCGSCNSEKRDRAPADFYTAEELARLAEITEVPLADLQSLRPNEQAIKELLSRLVWFFEEFLQRPEMTKERDGKVAGHLVIKALHKVLARSEFYSGIDLVEEYSRGGYVDR
ncbi:hypothetical protein [Pseudorhodobacter aquimaris]|uniref:hypothetical protein n=1 Tax=Pseudorhodobacter aquimaris TaxID=687412 RepID=UPI000A97E917|nr:hypothetical protein [Pseudorhodobacter aquimaris]